jgi:adenylate kinase
MNVILLGAPGAGKGTQAELLSDEQNIKHISSGDLFRIEVSKETPLGLEAKSYMDQGELVPDQVVINMINQHLPTDRGFLLDGFPRTLDQAKALDANLAAQQRRIDIVLNINVPEAQLTERLVSRRRSDDNLETIQNRLKVYTKQTQPLIAFYEDQNLLVHIDGNQPVENVAQQIQSAVKGIQ